MPVSKYAEQLSDQLRSFFPIADGGELAGVIDFNAKFIERHRDELASLLFIEFGECDDSEITLEMAKKVVARVQKRIFRSTQNSHLEIKKEIQSDESLSESEIQRILKEYVESLVMEDMVLFHLRYLEGKTVNEICKRTGGTKSHVYKKLGELREGFERFIRTT